MVTNVTDILQKKRKTFVFGEIKDSITAFFKNVKAFEPKHQGVSMQTP